MIDGLDEARRDRDLLFDDLSELGQRKDVHLVCTSRYQRDQSNLRFERAELAGLTNEQIATYLEGEGIQHPQSIIYRFNSAGRNLMRNPLHLSCIAKCLEKKGAGSTVPKNLAAVYNTCLCGMLRSKVEPDGNTDVDYLIHQLGSFAYRNLLDSTTPPLRVFLMSSSIEAQEAERIEAAGKRGGLLVATSIGTEFSHAVFQEYLAANYLSKLSESQIESFCSEHRNDGHLRNLFRILCGCIDNKQKQAVILDYLEANNLSLYMDCLRSRFNLSESMQGSLAKKDIEELAEQSLKSYRNLSSTYLQSMKPHLPFWQSLSTTNAPIQAVFTYDLATTTMQIELSEQQDTGGDLVVSPPDNREEALITTPDGTTMPLLSLRASNQPGLHMYKPEGMYGGLDCAREIAVSMIMDDIRDFFSSPFPIVYEPFSMRVGIVEEALRKCSIKHTSNDGYPRNLSLKNCNSEAFGVLIDGKAGQTVMVEGRQIPLSALYYLMRALEQEGQDYLALLPPPTDVPKPKDTKNWNHYKEETIRTHCATILLAREKAYRQYIETFMCELGPYLGRYASGPNSLRMSFAKGQGDGFESDWRIHVTPWPVEKEGDAKVVFVAEDLTSEGLRKRSDEYAKAARMLGRVNPKYHESRMGSATLLGDVLYIRKTVIRRVKEEIEDLFRLN